MKKVLPAVFLGISALSLPWCIHRIFLDTPIEAEMGTAQKIFYFHVPLAWICLLFALVAGVSAGIQLKSGSERARAVAGASAEMVVLSGLGVLVTGPIWGDATWGTPWTGDARQTITALLWLMFVAYLLLTRFAAGGGERLAAALAIFGAVNVPIIYYAVRIWKTTHPDTSVATTLPSEMRMTLYPCLFALLLAASALVMIRTRQQAMAFELDEAWIALDEKTT